jgi:hypothetical protein
MSGALISERMRAAVGSPLASGQPFAVEKGSIRDLAEAINHLHPLYVDEAYAQSTGHGSVLAPPTYPSYNLALGAPLEVLTFEFPVGSILHGSDDWEFLGDIHAGDMLTPQGKLLDLYEKQGKRGGMLFIVSEITYTNQRGEVVAIYRPTEVVIALPTA